MSKKSAKIKEFVEEPKSKRKKTGSKYLLPIIDGSFLTHEKVVKQIPFVLFLGLLGMIYIGNRNASERTIRETIKLQKEIKELRSEAISTTAELMRISKQSEVKKLLERYNLNLEAPVEPPVVISVKRENAD
ncbi:MAG: FtsL-like putative cell division protein [Bacteroidales bacterium]|jgi:hypothetical protein|nr:FtsL-like putative cell division protein [Bacteroidales bacterium]